MYEIRKLAIYHDNIPTYKVASSTLRRASPNNRRPTSLYEQCVFHSPYQLLLPPGLCKLVWPIFTTLVPESSRSGLAERSDVKLKSTASTNGLRVDDGVGGATSVNVPAPFTLGEGDADRGIFPNACAVPESAESADPADPGSAGTAADAGWTGRNASAYHSYHTLFEPVSRQRSTRSSDSAGR